MCTTLDPIYVEPIDFRVRPVFELSIVADGRTADGRVVDRIYRCRVGAKDINEAYRKLLLALDLPWYIAEHAYHKLATGGGK